MTTAAEDTKVIHDCNGSVTDFAFTFKIFAEGDIKVILTDSDDNETVLTVITDYTMVGENGKFESGGTVSTVKEIDGVMTSYAYATGYTITILLDLSLKQETDLEYGGSYKTQALEEMSDRLTKIAQQLNEKLKRAILFKRSSSLSELEMPDPTTGYFLYSPDGVTVGWVEQITSGTATITAFIKTLLDDANASAALTTLGLSTFIKTLIDDVNAYAARKTLKTPLSRVLTTAKTSAYTIQASDDGMLVTVDATAGNIAITFLPVGDLWNGFAIGIKKTDSSGNYVESTPDGTEKIDSESSHIIRKQNEAVWYVVDGTGWKIAGTGNWGLTSYGVLIGAGQSSMVASAALTAGQLIIGQTSSDPLPKTTSGDVTIATDGVLTIGDEKVTGRKIEAYGAGDNLIESNDAETSKVGIGYVIAKKIMVKRSGGFRIKFDLKSSHINWNAYGQIYRDDVAVGTERVRDQETYETFSEDIANWVYGEEIVLKIKAQAGHTVYVRNLRIYIGDEVPGRPYNTKTEV